jgi:surfeit locus 1 family protein
LIDNQITAGVVGYKIYSPFYFNENNNFVMVDRGWIKQGKSRAALPNISFISTPSRIVGTLISPEVGVLAGPELLTDAWPKVSQSRSIDVVSDAFIDKPIPQVLVLDPGSKFSEEYIPISPFAISPTKHYGYALQWFTMALVLLGMFIYTLTKENNEK